MDENILTGPKSIEFGEYMAKTSFFFHSHDAFKPCANAIAVCLSCANVYDLSVVESTKITNFTSQNNPYLLSDLHRTLTLVIRIYSRLVLEQMSPDIHLRDLNSRIERFRRHFLSNSIQIKQIASKSNHCKRYDGSWGCPPATISQLMRGVPTGSRKLSHLGSQDRGNILNY